MSFITHLLAFLAGGAAGVVLVSLVWFVRELNDDDGSAD